MRNIVIGKDKPSKKQATDSQHTEHQTENEKNQTINSRSY